MIQVTGTFEIEGREVIRTEQQEQTEDNDNGELPDVLALINETQHDPDHLNDVSVIPLQCGMGKSTAISKKIREVIENLDEDGNGDGLLVVTDNVARMKAYLQCDDPGYEPELFAFLEKNMTKITVMTHDNVIEAAIRMCETPVLLITTQRYFNMLTINEIDRDYLCWKGGRRTLILIDGDFIDTERKAAYAAALLTRTLRNHYSGICHSAVYSTPYVPSHYDH